MKTKIISAALATMMTFSQAAQAETIEDSANFTDKRMNFCLQDINKAGIRLGLISENSMPKDALTNVPPEHIVRVYHEYLDCLNKGKNIDIEDLGIRP